MSLSGDEIPEYLGSLEFLLESDPQGKDAELREFFRKLQAFVEADNIEVAEVTVRMMGTAVGGQSEWSNLDRSSTELTSAEGWQTPYRESGILTYAIHGLSVTDHESPLAKQYLRVIGNSVADNGSYPDLAYEYVTISD